MRVVAGKPLLGCLSILLIGAGVLTTGEAWARERVLHRLNGVPDGMLPTGGLALDAAGNLYGTASMGGTNGFGTVFMLSRKPNNRWSFTPIYQLTGGADGAFPQGTPALDSAGNLYITALQGGDATAQAGAVFQLVHGHDNAWHLGRIFDFDGVGRGRNGNGAHPGMGVIADAAGNLYGLAPEGGEGDEGYGYGTVFELTPSHGGFAEQTLFRFRGGKHGEFPTASLVMSPDGDLYGSTPYGGSYSYGDVFKLHKTGGAWHMTIVHSFNYPAEGDGPTGNLVLDRHGNIYGTTNTYAGTVFKLARPSNLPPDSAANLPANVSDARQEWPLTTLYQFPYGYGSAGVAFDKAGNLYTAGTIGGDQPCQCGEVLKLEPTQSGPWKATLLYSFPNGRAGENPYGTLVLGPDNMLYGATLYGGRGGEEGDGIVYAVRK